MLFRTIRYVFAALLCVFSMPQLWAGGTKGKRPELGKPDMARTSYDVLHYDIGVRLMPDQKAISGQNRIRFRMRLPARMLRLDLAENMLVGEILFKGQPLPYVRRGAKLYLQFPELLHRDSIYRVSISFSGRPQIAVKPPWEGGFVWSKDFVGNDWIGMACESLGASSWLPCKDLWSDEADSMDMHLTVPGGLTGVSNGRLISTLPADSGFTTFHWQVRNPINHYNISINAGRYAHISDTFNGPEPLSLDYYVLEYNRAEAQQHFVEVHGMLKAYTHYFGPYPFPEDGYKLVETPYWGMEHQSCIAYGNHYQNNPFGFDFIIIHESGHEWFANSITAYDPADMWIHESFTTYGESLYLEYTRSKTLALEYLLEQKKKIKNKSPMQGPRNVYYHGWKDSDIYYKGTWLLHSMRSVLNNDSLWFAALQKLNTQFRLQMVNSEQVIDFLSAETQYQWAPFFKQYLNNTHLPELKIKALDLGNGRIQYTLKLSRVNKDFKLPLHLNTKAGHIPALLQAGTETVLLLDTDFDLYDYLNKYYVLRVQRGGG